MFNWTAASIVIVAMMAVLAIRECHTAPAFQEFEQCDGYVPVYIRIGDTPLNEINLKLAEAFSGDNSHEPASTEDPFDQFAESKSSEEDEEMQASIEAHVEPDTSEASDENVVEESSPTPTIPSGETDVEHPEESIE